MVQEHIQWALAEVMQSDVQQVDTNVTRNKEEDGSASDTSLGKNTVNRKTQRLARSVEKGMPKHK
jgi:epoxyqueuosine reductase